MIETAPIKLIPIVSPSPSTQRVDAVGASAGTTTQRAESRGLVSEDYA